MPRAENRKRPPNMSRNTHGPGNRNKQYGGQDVSGSQNALDKKQELLEKMRNIQARKKPESNPE